jgi:hypothetical protein
LFQPSKGVVSSHVRRTPSSHICLKQLLQTLTDERAVHLELPHYCVASGESQLAVRACWPVFNGMWSE